MNIEEKDRESVPGILVATLGMFLFGGFIIFGAVEYFDSDTLFILWGTILEGSIPVLFATFISWRVIITVFRNRKINFWLFYALTIIGGIAFSAIMLSL